MKTIFTSTVLALAGLVLVSCVRNEFDDGNLRNYAENGDTNSLSRYLVTTTNVNRLFRYTRRDWDFAALLHFAIQGGQLETIKLLLVARAHPNQKDSDGRGPLMWVVGLTKNGVNQATREQMLKMLLVAGADPNLQDKDGVTALIWASSFGHVEFTKQLLNSGAKVNFTDEYGYTALHLAKNPEVARLLLNAGADISLKNSTGETPIDVAIRQKHPDVVHFLTNFYAPTLR